MPSPVTGAGTPRGFGAARHLPSGRSPAVWSLRDPRIFCRTFRRHPGLARRGRRHVVVVVGQRGLTAAISPLAAWFARPGARAAGVPQCGVADRVWLGRLTFWGLGLGAPSTHRLGDSRAPGDLLAPLIGFLPPRRRSTRGRAPLALLGRPMWQVAACSLRLCATPRAIVTHRAPVPPRPIDPADSTRAAHRCTLLAAGLFPPSPHVSYGPHYLAASPGTLPRRGRHANVCVLVIDGPRRRHRAVPPRALPGASAQPARPAWWWSPTWRHSPRPAPHAGAGGQLRATALISSTWAPLLFPPPQRPRVESHLCLFGPAGGWRRTGVGSPSVVPHVLPAGAAWALAPHPAAAGATGHASPRHPRWPPGPHASTLFRACSAAVRAPPAFCWTRPRSAGLGFDGSPLPLSGRARQATGMRRRTLTRQRRPAAPPTADNSRSVPVPWPAPGAISTRWPRCLCV